MNASASVSSRPRAREELSRMRPISIDGVDLPADVLYHAYAPKPGESCYGFPQLPALFGTRWIHTDLHFLGAFCRTHFLLHIRGLVCFVLN